MLRPASSDNVQFVRLVIVNRFLTTGITVDEKLTWKENVKQVCLYCIQICWCKSYALR